MKKRKQPRRKRRGILSVLERFRAGNPHQEPPQEKPHHQAKLPPTIAKIRVPPPKPPSTESETSPPPESESCRNPGDLTNPGDPPYRSLLSLTGSRGTKRSNRPVRHALPAPYGRTRPRRTTGNPSPNVPVLRRNPPRQERIPPQQVRRRAAVSLPRLPKEVFTGRRQTPDLPASRHLGGAGSLPPARHCRYCRRTGLPPVRFAGPGAQRPAMGIGLPIRSSHRLPTRRLETGPIRAIHSRRSDDPGKPAAARTRLRLQIPPRQNRRDPRATAPQPFCGRG